MKNLRELSPRELKDVLRTAVEQQDGKTIKAVKDEYNRRCKYDE